MPLLLIWVFARSLVVDGNQLLSVWVGVPQKSKDEEAEGEEAPCPQLAVTQELSDDLLGPNSGDEADSIVAVDQGLELELASKVFGGTSRYALSDDCFHGRSENRC